jgi:hypothetical protein
VYFVYFVVHVSIHRTVNGPSFGIRRLAVAIAAA